jgi:long-chain acyl-CoA synthetase
VDTTDPRTALVQLVAAELAGAVPVVCPGSWSPEARARSLRAAEELPTTCAGPWLVLPTSGTTSSPRAVVRTARSWDDSHASFSALTGLGRQDLVWAPGEMSSTLTLFAVRHAVSCAVPVLASGRWRGAAAAGRRAAEATVLHCVPALLPEILAARDQGLLGRLRSAVVGGAALGPSLRTALRDRGVGIVEYYGAAELSFVAADADDRGLRAFPGVDVRVERGLVEVRSDHLAEGYLDPLRGGPLRVHDGWATVGDRGRFTPTGALEILGRGGRTAGVGGHTVLLADVEAELAGVEGVAELLCLAVPHPRLGQVLAAAVRPLPGVDPRDRLRATARRRLPAPARPLRYLLVDDLPRTPGGKPDLRRVSRLFDRDRPAVEPASEACRREQT